MPSRWTERRKRFRAVFDGSACVHPASVHDPVSARIAADLGFETGMFAGSVASLAVLGAPDLDRAHADRVRRPGLPHRPRAADLPLLVDADHGYGNALNVMRTVEELRECRAWPGCRIEDTLLPRAVRPSDSAADLDRGRRGQDEGGAGRRGAIRTRRSPGAPAPSASPAWTDTIARAQGLRATGVDAMFLVGVKTREQLEAVRGGGRACRIILGGVPAALVDRAYLATKGVRVCLQGHQPFQAAVRAIHDTLKALRDGTAPKDPPASLRRR